MFPCFVTRPMANLAFHPTQSLGGKSTKPFLTREIDEYKSKMCVPYILLDYVHFRLLSCSKSCLVFYCSSIVQRIDE